MYYIFEDNKEDALSKLILASMNNTENILFSNGSSKIIREIRKLDKKLRNNGDNSRIGVFMDAPMGNEQGMAQLSEVIETVNDNYSDRVVVVPIYCLEYFLIQHLAENVPCISNKAVDICLNFEDFYKSPILVTDKHFSYCNSFERYCKLVQKLAFLKCTGEYGRNLYLTEDCKCKSYQIGCKSIEINDKSRDILTRFPLIPLGNTIDYPKRTINFIEAKLIANEICDEIDSLSYQLSKVCTNKECKFTSITARQVI